MRKLLNKVLLITSLFVPILLGSYLLRINFTKINNNNKSLQKVAKSIPKKQEINKESNSTALLNNIKAVKYYYTNAILKNSQSYKVYNKLFSYNINYKKNKKQNFKSKLVVANYSIKSEIKKLNMIQNLIINHRYNYLFYLNKNNLAIPNFISSNHVSDNSYLNINNNEYQIKKSDANVNKMSSISEENLIGAKSVYKISNTIKKIVIKKINENEANFYYFSTKKNKLVNQSNNLNQENIINSGSNLNAFIPGGGSTSNPTIHYVIPGSNIMPYNKKKGSNDKTGDHVAEGAGAGLVILLAVIFIVPFNVWYVIPNIKKAYNNKTIYKSEDGGDQLERSADSIIPVATRREIHNSEYDITHVLNDNHATIAYSEKLTHVEREHEKHLPLQFGMDLPGENDSTDIGAIPKDTSPIDPALTDPAPIVRTGREKVNNADELSLNIDKVNNTPEKSKLVFRNPLSPQHTPQQISPILGDSDVVMIGPGVYKRTTSPIGIRRSVALDTDSTDGISLENDNRLKISELRNYTRKRENNNLIYSLSFEIPRVDLHELAAGPIHHSRRRQRPQNSLEIEFYEEDAQNEHKMTEELSDKMMEIKRIQSSKSLLKEGTTLIYDVDDDSRAKNIIKAWPMAWKIRAKEATEILEARFGFRTVDEQVMIDALKNGSRTTTEDSGTNQAIIIGVDEIRNLLTSINYSLHSGLLQSSDIKNNNEALAKNLLEHFSRFINGDIKDFDPASYMNYIKSEYEIYKQYNLFTELIIDRFKRIKHLHKDEALQYDLLINLLEGNSDWISSTTGGHYIHSLGAISLSRAYRLRDEMISLADDINDTLQQGHDLKQEARELNTSQNLIADYYSIIRDLNLKKNDDQLVVGLRDYPYKTERTRLLSVRERIIRLQAANTQYSNGYQRIKESRDGLKNKEQTQNIPLECKNIDGETEEVDQFLSTDHLKPDNLIDKKSLLQIQDIKLQIEHMLEL